MGVPPFLVASSIQAVLAQRLVRVICPDCKEPVETEPARLKAIGLRDEQIQGNIFYHGAGCDNCKNRGFRGRRAIYEIMVLNSRIRDMTFNEDTTDNIRNQAVKDGMHTLLMDGARKVVEGVTVPEEVLTVAKNIE
jgi:type IV pilus assembly protein PilB